MNSNNFSAIEIDAIGEILNISLGASATAVSTMLSSRVDISTPIVKVLSKAEFEFADLEPAIGVEITYISGLEGSNIMLLKRHDVKVIVDMLMGVDTPEEDFELNELNISAICEVMNQMMGASSTALSEFLNKMVNISTPTSFAVEDEKEFKDKYFNVEDTMVVVEFTLRIGDQLQSEFINVIPCELAKELVSGFLPPEMLSMEDETSDIKPIGSTNDAVGQPVSVPEDTTSSSKVMSEEEIQHLLSGMSEGSKEEMPAPLPTPTASVQPSPVIPEPAAMPMQPVMPIEGYGDTSVMQLHQQTMAMMQQMQQTIAQLQSAAAMESAQPKTINAHLPLRANSLEVSDIEVGVQEENRELIMGVPLEVSVEIGRTTKLVKDILEFTKGSLVILDKLAGEQVDLFVNGQCVAKGDVVVVDDNFGIRITEIVKRNIPRL